MTHPDFSKNRAMNADELRGFNLALACLMRWGSQIERNGVSLGGPADLVPRNQMMRHGGRMVRHCAEALALTEGQRQLFPAQSKPIATGHLPNG